MASPARQYTDEVHEAFSYWATWLPNAAVAVGDCGPVKDRVFDPQTTLAEFDVGFDVQRGKKPLDFQYATEGGVNYTLQLAAGNQTIPQIPQGKAGIEVAFGRQNAVVLLIRNAYEHRLANIHAVRRDVLERGESGDFPREYAIVSHVVVARSATILISRASDTKFTVSAEADLKAGLLDLANAKLGLSRVAADKFETEIVAAEGLTPLFRLIGFKRNGWFWGSPRVENLGFEDDEEPGDLGAVEPTDTDPEDPEE